MAPPVARRPPKAPTAVTTKDGKKTVLSLGNPLKKKVHHDENQPLPAPPKDVRQKNSKDPQAAKKAAQAEAALKQENAKRKNADEVDRSALPSFMAAGANVPLANLSRKELQKRAIAAGLKANASSADIIKALQTLQDSVSAGFELLSANSSLLKPLPPKTGATPARTREQRELAELEGLGIKGRTPGGNRWRTRVATHSYDLRSDRKVEQAAAAPVEVA
jgi:hypothetical protein